MNFYIASGLENAKEVSSLAARLKQRGWEHTYDWTQHPADPKTGIDEFRQIAKEELQGVKDADVVIVLLPGARGTHVELGVAIALDKPVFLYAERADMLRDSVHGLLCPFYLYPNITLVFRHKEILLYELYKWERGEEYGTGYGGGLRMSNWIRELSPKDCDYGHSWCADLDRLIDEAGMYHLWVLPDGSRLPFGLHGDDEPTETVERELMKAQGGGVTA